MKIRYECEKCKRQFDDKTTCALHETSHIEDDTERIKYFILRYTTEDICKYCSHVYYVYGCEPSCGVTDCCEANNYKCFIPLDILRPEKYEKFNPDDFKGVDIHE